MAADVVKTICVVGAGNMGHQIALSAALAGYKVTCTDISPEMLKKAQDFAESYLPDRGAKGKLSEDVARATQQNLTFTTNLQEAAKDADLVIEAAVENLPIKRKIFAELDRICPPHAILASNSSYIVSSKFADATKRPEKVCNVHFFNPALVMKTVEVVKGEHTSLETVNAAMEVCKKMGKSAVLLNKEIYGFIVNRIWNAARTEALYLYDLGVASAEDIDTAVTNGLGWPMGPFKLMDLVGIDLACQIYMGRFQETGDPADRPSPVLVEKAAKKEWGRKTGKGFYEYK